MRARLLVVDLDSGSIDIQDIPGKTSAAYLGGFGLNQRLAFDWIQAGADPLGGENAIVLGTGPLVGTGVAAACRVCATAKLPLTGAVATANGGMRFARQMRLAGFDHAVILGRSARPVYLAIAQGRAHLKSAAHLWSRDLYETTDALYEAHGKSAGVIAIGPAGERLAAIALTLVDRTSTLGKGGLGAVFGAKNLKAIVAHGGGQLHGGDGDRLAQLAGDLKRKALAQPSTESRIRLGAWRSGTRSFRGILFDNYRRIFPKEGLRERYGPEVYVGKALDARRGCPSCPVPDKDRYCVRDGPAKGLVTYGNSFLGRMLGFGLRCGAGDYGQALTAHDLANRQGLCGHSLVALFEFCLELQEVGIIGPSELRGLSLERGFRPIMAFIQAAANREGLGEAVAGGYPALIGRFGEEAAARAVHLHGVDVIFDPRDGGLGTVEFEQLVSPRHHWVAGASPTYAKARSSEAFRSFGARIGLDERETEQLFGPRGSVDIPRLTRHAEDWYALLSSVGVCTRGHIDSLYDIDVVSQLLEAATGLELRRSELRAAAERGWTLFKMLNSREGHVDDRTLVPPRWFEPLERVGGGELPAVMDYEGARSLSRQDVEGMIGDYYEARGWAPDSGLPSQQLLAGLELGS
ncbi:MAG: hypothetical protein M5U22_17010 [Thermoleophilia bacterium]|nr:hypothetical protein [Thermoleophilia bacterium]